jgi:hypothetical protein
MIFWILIGFGVALAAAYLVVGIVAGFYVCSQTNFRWKTVIDWPEWIIGMKPTPGAPYAGPDPRPV